MLVQGGRYLSTAFAHRNAVEGHLLGEEEEKRADATAQELPTRTRCYVSGLCVFGTVGVQFSPARVPSMIKTRTKAVVLAHS